MNTVENIHYQSTCFNYYVESSLDSSLKEGLNIKLLPSNLVTTLGLNFSHDTYEYIKEGKIVAKSYKDALIINKDIFSITLEKTS